MKVDLISFYFTMRLRLVLAAALSMLLAGCGSDTVKMEDFDTRLVTLPGGQRIRAEIAMKPVDMARGLMFRDSLAPDRGMLFIHEKPGQYSYWMYQTRIPLDILWMGADRRIVEMSLDTPPCGSKSARECPHYGGTEPSRYVLELAGGTARKFGLRVGDRIEF